MNQNIKNFHKIRLNLPAGFHEEFPNPLGAPIYIDDKPIRGLVRFSLETSPENGATIVNISLVASVEGLVHVDDPCLLVVQAEEEE